MKAGTIGLATVAWTVWSGAASAEEKILDVSWARLQQEGRVLSGEVALGERGSVLRLTGAGEKPGTLPLVVLENPGVTRSTYALRGEVQYSGVSGQAYLEMWSHFAEGAFFSRTLAGAGPMRPITGSSKWRSFVLPFSNNEGGAPPAKLVVNLVLPGAGAVEVSDLTLVQYAPGESPFEEAGGWFSEREAGLWGGMAGLALGLLWGLIGFLGSRGTGRSFVLAAVKAMMAVGAVALAFGACAFFGGQPHDVYFMLGSFGAVALAVSALLLPKIRRRYEEIELRRMRALDASG